MLVIKLGIPESCSSCSEIITQRVDRCIANRNGKRSFVIWFTFYPLHIEP